MCLYHWFGFSFCPGCSLGNSLSYLLHGQIIESFRLHPLGIPALIILLFRIAKLNSQLINHIKQLKRLNDGSKHAHVASGSRS
ncbi:MAG: DUF2752 domain-containing protein [Flavobacteriales bacterium]|nr:DUF2752 domain-containing protein [Flavobacteriales bacterium]